MATRFTSDASDSDASRAASCSASAFPQPARSGSVITGVLIVREAARRISRRRGMPRVTLASPRPAKWNVFSVICVDGSPTDCAARTPTASPGSARERMKLTCMTRLNFFRSLSVSAACDSAWPRRARASSANSCRRSSKASEVTPSTSAGLPSAMSGSCRCLASLRSCLARAASSSRRTLSSEANRCTLPSLARSRSKVVRHEVRVTSMPSSP
mmetsp:Transcript_5031/g.18314  ORF Transcript_5031/g.18314 Transcript_5031/m.18314 type:complete len:214 (+) Transcript_5031:1365-2006(+)